MTKAETISFKKGDSLLVEQPFVFVLKTNLNKERCDHCLQKSELLTCTGCNLIRYCDRICQKKAWTVHKKECKKMQRISPRILPDAARLLARIIFKLENGGAREQAFYSPRQFRVFMDLMSHYNEIKNDSKRMEHFQSLLAVLEIYFAEESIPNPIELLRIYGKMVVNTFCILDGEMNGIGTGMYLASSIVDHSCNPNAVAVFNGTTLNIRTLVDVPCLDWTKTFISYIDLLRLPNERQKELEDTYYFLCQCKRCSDVEELDLMTATLCQNDECHKQIMGGTRRPDVKCEHCGEIVARDTWETIVKTIDFIDDQLVAMKDVAYVDICRLCLQKQEGLFGVLNIRRARLLDLAMDSCIDLGLWEAAIEYGRQLIPPFQHYYGKLHPLTGILFMKLGKIALFLNLMEDARKYLKEAAQVLLVTHGNNHPLVRGELLSYMRQCTGTTAI